MKLFATPCVAILALGTASAQNIILQDDFNDGLVNPQWTVTFDQLAFWNAGEYTDSFHFTQLTTPFGAFDERYTLDHQIPGGLQGSFQLDSRFRWNDQQTSAVGEDAMVLVVHLYDSVGADIARFELNDRSSNNAGDGIFTGGTSVTLPNFPTDTGCRIQLIRDASDNLSYTIEMDGGMSGSGSLGLAPGDIEGCAFYVSHTTSGPFGQTFGQLHFDSIRLWDAPRDSDVLLLNSAMIAGLTASFDISEATPSGSVFLGYSLTGAGPTPTGFGIADLSAPINNFPPVTADAAGNATVDVAVPLGTSGTSVWFQALDLGSGTFSNGLMRVVL